MTTESVDIQVQGTVKPKIETDLRGIAKAASEGYSSLSRLQGMLDKLDTGGVASLVRAQAQLLNATAKVTAAESNASIGAAKLATEQQRLNTEVQKTQVQLANVEAALNKAVAAEAKATLSAQKLKAANDKAQQASKLKEEAAQASAAALQEEARAADANKARILELAKAAVSEANARREANAAHIAAASANNTAGAAIQKQTQFTQEQIRAAQDATRAARDKIAADRDLVKAETDVQQSQQRTTLGWRDYNTGLGKTGQNAQLARHHLVNLGFQLQDIGVSLASGQNPLTVAVQQGAQIQGIATQANTSIGRLALSAVAMVARFIPLAAAVGAVVGGLKIMSSELTKSSGPALEAYSKSLGLTSQQIKKMDGDVVTLTDTFKAFFTTVAASSGTTGWLDKFLDYAKTVFKDTVGLMVDMFNSFASLSTAAYQTFLGAWGGLPAGFRNIFVGIYNNAASILEALINVSIAGVNQITAAFSKITKISVPEIAAVPIARMDSAKDPAPVDLADTFINTYKSQFSKRQKEFEDFYKKWQANSVQAAKDRIKKSFDDAGGNTAKVDQQAKALAKLEAQTKAQVAAAYELSAAYITGKDKSRDYDIQLKIENEVLQTGEKNRKAVAKAINDQQDALDQLAISKEAYNLGKEAADTNALAVATLAGRDALDKYNIQKSLTIALGNKKYDIDSKQYQLLVKNNEEEAKAARRLQDANTANSVVDRLSPQIELTRKYQEEQSALNSAIAQGGPNVAVYADALVKLRSEYDANISKTTAWGQITELAIGRIDDAFADMWKSVLSKSGDFMETLKNSFKQFLAEMLHLAITKPIIVQIGSALGVGGLADSAGGGGGILSGVGGLISNISSVVSAAGSKFGQSILSGWNGGEGLAGGIQNAFSSGADYIKSAITTGFTSGSTTAANVASNFAASSAAGASQAGYTGTAFQGYVAGQNASASLSALSSTLSYIGAVYAVIQSFQAYGIKGAATTAGFAAGGAAIGSFVGPLGTAAGAAIGAVIGSIASSKLFGSGEKYADLSTSATGRYVNGQYTDTGIATNWQTKAPKFGQQVDSIMSSNLNKFAATLGMLYDTLGNGADVVAYNTLQVRKTSGKYSGTYGAQLDDGSILQQNNQFNAQDAAAALTANYDNIMGTFLAKAIVSSKSLPDYFKAQFADFANNWDTTADEVIAAIEGVFTRFNGVNDALQRINVGALKMNEVGLIASDNILNIVASFSDLDEKTATAKDKVDALNTVVGDYYSAFFTQAEQFSDLKKQLSGAFGSFGLALPDTREAYRKMVEDIDVTTAAGQAMFATFVGLAKNADSYYSNLEQTAEAAQQAAKDAAQSIIDKLMGNANNAFSALQRAISAQKDSVTKMLTTANTTASDLTAIDSSLGTALKSLRGDSEQAVTMLQAQARATLNAALASAKAGGSLVGNDNLSDALDTVGKNNTKFYTSLTDFNRDQGRTAITIAELEAINGKQLTAAQIQAKALQDQLDKLDDQLKFAQDQLDALNGIDNTLISVKDAISAMNVSVIAALQGLTGKPSSASASTNGSYIDTIYKEILGRADGADAPGKQYWLDQLNSGAISYGQLAQAIANAAKASGQKDVKAGYANGGMVNGMGGSKADAITAMLSNGEYVMTADTVKRYGVGVLDQMNYGSVNGYANGGMISDSSTLSPPQNNSSNKGADEIVDELRQLRDEIHRDLLQMAKHAESTAYNTSQIKNGIPIVGTVKTVPAT